MSFLSRIFSKKESKTVPRIPYEEILKTIKVNSNKIIDVKILLDTYKTIRPRYLTVSTTTGIPVDVIFAIHYRESSLDFRACLHNGERIIGTGKKTKLVPAGRGPFQTWEQAAIDALMLEKHNFPETWDVVGRLNFCETYNGIGYRNRNVPSPYILSWTNFYSSGKYISDGKYDSSYIDGQCGCAPLIIGILNDTK